MTEAAGLAATNIVKRAFDAARASYGSGERWLFLSAREQAAAIYQEMRKIDAETARARMRPDEQLAPLLADGPSAPGDARRKGD